MTFDEKVFAGLAIAGIAALLLWRNRSTDQSAPALPITDFVGASQTPENSDVTAGQEWLMYNRRYLLLPPLNNFLPTVTSGQAGQTVQKPWDFVRRWEGAIYKKREMIQ